MAFLLNLSMHKYPDFCDICEEERPSWYCAVDEAYLCDKCDSSVHEANYLTLRHERITLGYNEPAQKVPGATPDRQDIMFLSKIKHEGSIAFSSYYNWPWDSLRKDRNGRSNEEILGEDNSQNPFIKIGGITFTKATKVKLEPDSRFGDEQRQLKPFSAFSKRKEPENGSLVHEVPVLVPVAQDMPSTALQVDASRQSYLSSLTAPLETDPSICDFMGFLVPECCEVDDSPISHNGYPHKQEESSVPKNDDIVLFDESNEEKIFNQSKNNDSRDEFSLTGRHMAQPSIWYDYENYREPISGDFHSEHAELHVFKHSRDPEVFVPLTWVCEKLNLEFTGDQIDRQLEANIDGSSINNISSEKKSFNLRLNYDDILSAWSDRGCFWTDGHPAQAVPASSSSQLADEAATDVGVVPELSPENTPISIENKEEIISCTIGDGGREARVLRYKEKRRTRLFSKKIRYEVRKLNAERRPRIKGRFVKKSN